MMPPRVLLARRWVRFSSVGFAGLVVQLCSLWALTDVLGIH